MTVISDKLWHIYCKTTSAVYFKARKSHFEIREQRVDIITQIINQSKYNSQLCRNAAFN